MKNSERGIYETIVQIDECRANLSTRWPELHNRSVLACRKRQWWVVREYLDELTPIGVRTVRIQVSSAWPVDANRLTEAEKKEGQY